VLLTGGFGFDSYDSARTVNVNNFNAQATGNYDGWQSVVYGEYGRAFRVGSGRLTPYAGLQYIYLRQNGFMESGAGPVNLNVAGIDANSLRNVLGLRFDRSRRTRGGRLLTPQVRAAWLHEYLDTSTLASNRFIGVGGTSFAAQGLDLGRDWALLGAGLTWQITDHWSLAGNYDSQLNQNQTFHAGSGTLQYVW
jgi:outer membrane autotransporter protein